MLQRADITRLALLLIPPVLRKKRFFTLIKILVSPFILLEQDFARYRKEADERMRVNGQVIYIEKAMNDFFLLPEKEICLSETDLSGMAPETYLFDDSGTETYFYDEETRSVTYLSDGSQNESMMIIVNVPLYLQARKDELINLIEFYKPAGRRYRIEYYDL